jgi:hypothetical protein
MAVYIAVRLEVPLAVLLQIQPTVDWQTVTDESEERAGCSSPCNSPKSSWSSKIKFTPVSYVRDPGNHSIIDMRRLTTGIRSKKCVIRRFRCCGNVIACTYTNLDSIAYYTPSLYGIAYCSLATNLYSMLLY